MVEDQEVVVVDQQTLPRWVPWLVVACSVLLVAVGVTNLVVADGWGDVVLGVGVLAIAASGAGGARRAFIAARRP